MIRFPRRGPEGASILQIKTKGSHKHKRFKARDMCNWIDCNVSFGEIPTQHISADSDGSDISVESVTEGKMVNGQLCSKCKLVKYCSPEHQKKDWDEHRRVCVKM
jgi:hypothetical protein